MPGSLHGPRINTRAIRVESVQLLQDKCTDEVNGPKFEGFTEIFLDKIREKN